MIFAAVWWAFDLDFWSIVVFVALMGVVLSAAGRPLLEGLRRRQQAVIDQLKQAETAKAEADRLIAEEDRQRALFEARQKEALVEATRDAAVIHQEMVERARQDVQRLKDRLARDIELLRHAAILDLWHRTADLSSQVAERALRERLNDQDHSRLVDDAILSIAQSAREVA